MRLLIIVALVVIGIILLSAGVAVGVALGILLAYELEKKNGSKDSN